MPPTSSLALPVPSALNLRQFASLERERQTSAVFNSSECLCSYVRKDISPKKQKSQSQQSQSLELSTMFSH